MESILQKELSNKNSIIKLPSGEFRESITIDRPCTIIGNNTTLWNDTLPVLIVQSRGVVLKNLRLELTGISGYESNYPVLKLQDDTSIENVEIFGGVADTQKYYIPRSVHLGSVKSNCENTFIVKIYCPEDCSIITNSKSFTVEPNNLKAGYSSLTIKSLSLDENSMIFGDILLKSKLNRRIYVDGSVSKDVEKISNKVLYSYDNITQPQNNDISYVKIPVVQNTSSVVKNQVLQRGQRCFLDNLNMIVKFEFSKLLLNLDIDPYIFLTDINNKAKYDQDMVFFGNTVSEDGSVAIQNDNSITVDLSKTYDDIQRISICYSIYKGGISKNFSFVKNPRVKVFDSYNNLLFEIDLSSVGNLYTVIALEFYRHKNKWKINCVVAGYNNGLPKLCQSFGLDATY